MALRTLSTAFMVLSVFILIFVSCGGDDNSDQNEGIERSCPEPSEIPGEYAFCVWADNPPKGEGGIIWDRTTPVGNYEAGTQITVEAVQAFEYSDFYGWYLDNADVTGTISKDNPYTFTLEEDTYLYVVYLIQY